MKIYPTEFASVIVHDLERIMYQWRCPNNSVPEDQMIFPWYHGLFGGSVHRDDDTVFAAMKRELYEKTKIPKTDVWNNLQAFKLYLLPLPTKEDSDTPHNCKPLLGEGYTHVLNWVGEIQVPNVHRVKILEGGPMISEKEYDPRNGGSHFMMEHDQVTAEFLDISTPSHYSRRIDSLAHRIGSASSLLCMGSNGLKGRRVETRRYEEAA